MLHFFDGFYEKLLRKSEKSNYVVAAIRVFLTKITLPSFSLLYHNYYASLTSVGESECFIPIMRLHISMMVKLKEHETKIDLMTIGLLFFELPLQAI